MFHSFISSRKYFWALFQGCYIATQTYITYLVTKQQPFSAVYTSQLTSRVQIFTLDTYSPVNFKYANFFNQEKLEAITISSLGDIQQQRTLPVNEHL